MSKEFGHTKTLFKKGNKYYWSFKYDYCQKCGKVDKPHKGNGLCARCWDKKRAKTKKRKILRKIVQKRFGIRKRIFRILKTPEKKLIGLAKIYGPATPERAKEVRNKAHKRYYEKNKRLMYLKYRIWLLRKKGVNLQYMMINGEKKFFPWEGLIKKPLIDDPNYKKYKQQQKDFILLKKYYENKNKNNS